MHIVVLLLSRVESSLSVGIFYTNFSSLFEVLFFQDLGMESFEMKTEKIPSERLTEKGFLIGQAAVRTMSIATTLIAIVLMTTSKQHMQLFGFQIAASYSYSPAFKFCVAANSVACFLSVTSLSVFLYYVRLAHPSQKIYFIMFLLDLMVMLCVVSGSSAATAIGYLGQYGNSHAGWMPICDHFGKFCNRIKASLILTYLSALLFTVLTVWTTLKAIKLQFSSISETTDEHNSKIRKENKIGNGFVSAS